MMMRLLLAAGMFLFQMQEPPDAEEGKPLSCDNFRNTPVAARCACGKAMHDKCDMPAPSVMNDAKCKTTCRPDHCKCMSAKCTT